MTEAEANALIEETADRTTAHVLQVIEEHIRDFAAVMPPAVPGSVALLALADDIRDSLPSFRIRLVSTNVSCGEAIN